MRKDAAIEREGGEGVEDHWRQGDSIVISLPSLSVSAGGDGWGWLGCVCGVGGDKGSSPENKAGHADRPVLHLIPQWP